MNGNTPFYQMAVEIAGDKSGLYTQAELVFKATFLLWLDDRFSWELQKAFVAGGGEVSFVTDAGWYIEAPVETKFFGAKGFDILRGDGYGGYSSTVNFTFDKARNLLIIASCDFNSNLVWSACKLVGEAQDA